MISLNKFIKSLKHALRGLKQIFIHEQSFRMQVAIAISVFILMILLPLATWERILVILMIAAVLVLEVINSIFERISDALKPRLHPMVREVKDMMAGAVLVAAVTSAIVAGMIFLPHVRDYLL